MEKYLSSHQVDDAKKKELVSQINLAISSQRKERKDDKKQEQQAQTQQIVESIYGEIKEYVLTSIYYRHETTYYVDCGNGKYYAYRDINDKDCNEAGTDVYAVYHNQLSITKISKTSLYKEN